MSRTYPKALSKNEYDQDRQAKEHESLKLGAKWQDTWEAVLSVLTSADVRPAVKVTEEGGKPIRGVNWRSASTPEGLVVNLYNAKHDPVTFKLAPDATFIDLLNDEKIAAGTTITLQPMETRLLRSAEIK